MTSLSLVVMLNWTKTISKLNTYLIYIVEVGYVMSDTMLIILKFLPAYIVLLQ